MLYFFTLSYLSNHLFLFLFPSISSPITQLNDLNLCRCYLSMGLVDLQNYYFLISVVITPSVDSLLDAITIFKV